MEMSVKTKYRPSGHVDLRRLRRCARRLQRAYRDIGIGMEHWIYKATRRFGK